MITLLVLKDKEQGHEPGYVGSLKKVEKAKKWVPRVSRKKCNILLTPSFQHCETWISHPQNCKKINQCCFKLLNSWSFVIVAIKKQQTSCVTLDKLADLFEPYLYDMVSNQPVKVALLVRSKSYRQCHQTNSSFNRMQDCVFIIIRVNLDFSVYMALSALRSSGQRNVADSLQT